VASMYSFVKCLWVRPGAHPREEHVKGTSLRYTLVLPANIRLVWSGLTGTSTPAYY